MTQFTTKAAARRLTGIQKLGDVSQTVKHEKAMKYGEVTYSLYLAPADKSGYEVCPGRTKECTILCLNESGMNSMTQKVKGDVINNARIKKTKLFFEDRELFMGWVIQEIEDALGKANQLGYKFSVRINNTSDISPEDMVYKGHNILEYFADVQFYDYTKVPERVKLMTKYPNYDLTFSFNGYNMHKCEQMLKNNIRVAMVFNKVPDAYMGYKVIDGDKYDMRYKDDGAVIIGLKYKRTRAKLNSNYKFVIQ